ncbi:MAG: acyl-CoA dehydrogenase family protein [Gammaproteobacteria bacterium]
MNLSLDASRAARHNELPDLAALAPPLARAAAAAEQHGVLSAQAVALLRDAGLFGLWRPRALGGLEVDPLAFARIAETVARIDSACAWLLMSVAVTSFDLRLASRALLDEIFADGKEPVLCESFNRPLEARAVDGGWQVSGAVPFMSNCRVADWIGHTALDGERFLLMFHPAAALDVKDDWDTLGMRGTASNTVSASDVFVPAHRAIDLGAPRTANGCFEGPLYRLPEALITATFPPVALGVLETALAAAEELAATHRPFAADGASATRPLTQLALGQARATAAAGRAYLESVLATAWARAESGAPFALTDKAAFFLATTHVLQTCAAACARLARALGTASIRRGNPLERALRDSEVIARHAFGAEARYASVAQAHLGLPVDFPLMAMD